MMARNIIACAALLWCAQPVRADDAGAFDIVIANGHIIDGTGSPWYSGDVGIRDGRVWIIDAPATNGTGTAHAVSALTAFAPMPVR